MFTIYLVAKKKIKVCTSPQIHDVITFLTLGYRLRKSSCTLAAARGGAYLPYSCWDDLLLHSKEQRVLYFARLLYRINLMQYLAAFPNGGVMAERCRLTFLYLKFQTYLTCGVTEPRRTGDCEYFQLKNVSGKHCFAVFSFL